jgi:hypothetical protein
VQMILMRLAMVLKLIWMGLTVDTTNKEMRQRSEEAVKLILDRRMAAIIEKQSRIRAFHHNLGVSRQQQAAWMCDPLGIVQQTVRNVFHVVGYCN